MKMAYDEDQLFLQKTAREFVKAKSPVSRMRALRDTKDAVGFSKELWKEMAELGWLGVNLPESFGGSNMGFADLCILLEETGRNLMPEPFIETVVTGAELILQAGTPAQKQTWLSAIAAGDAVVALAYQEARSRYNVCDVQVQAEASGDGFVLSGEKIQVLQSSAASVLVVTARTRGKRKDEDGITLFLVDPKSEGVQLKGQSRVDSLNANIVSLSNVQVGAGAVLGTVHEATAVLSPALDKARIAMAAQMLGSAEQAFSLAVDYLKERKQFGVPIGSFQALQHRATKLFVELELTRSAVLAAASCVDEDPEKAAMMASLAKAKASECFLHVANEAIQFHGGIGVTDEYDLGFYLKRARAASQTLGDADFHRERWAKLNGY
jgi:alkylation response protein AidB-like acyl-CoA dehydrogenase